MTFINFNFEESDISDTVEKIRKVLPRHPSLGKFLSLFPNVRRNLAKCSSFLQ